MSAEKDINTALSARLKTIQSAGVPPIAWENSNYQPSENVLFLREKFIPNMKDAVGISHNSSEDYVGLYQVTVTDGRGDKRFDAQDQARLVAIHFVRGTELTYNGVGVKITSARIIQGFNEENFYNVPVLIEWRAVV